MGSNETSASRMRSQISGGTDLGFQKRTPRERLLEMLRYLIFIILLSVVSYGRNIDYGRR